MNSKIHCIDSQVWVFGTGRWNGEWLLCGVSPGITTTKSNTMSLKTHLSLYIRNFISVAICEGARLVSYILDMAGIKSWRSIPTRSVQSVPDSVCHCQFSKFPSKNSLPPLTLTHVPLPLVLRRNLG